MERYNQITELYNTLIKSWNNRDANGFSELFSNDGNVVGFDGSQMNGREAINEELTRIFNNHKTASFVTIIREIRFLAENVALLRAAVGMVLPDTDEIHEAANAIQSLIAVQIDGKWNIELFQNTPAEFHGRPELHEQLTSELQEVYDNNQK